MRKRYLPPLEESDTDEPLINLTPLIDVVFVILITFMLIAPVLNADSVDLARGGVSHQKEFQSSPITITVHADNTIWIQKRKVTLQELQKILTEEKRIHPYAVPHLIHDQVAQFGTYQSVKTIVEQAGFERMDVILNPL